MKEDYPFPDEAFKLILKLYREEKISMSERKTIIDVLYDYVSLKIFYQRSKINTIINDEKEEKFFKGFAYEPTERIEKIILMQKEIEETIELRDNYIGEMEE